MDDSYLSFVDIVDNDNSAILFFVLVTTSPVINLIFLVFLGLFEKLKEWKRGN